VVVVDADGDPTAFSSFNFDSDAWSDQLVTSFTSAALQITVPPALGGNFKFTPQITEENDDRGASRCRSRRREEAQRKRTAQPADHPGDLRPDATETADPLRP